jgi:hypothetical protein
MLCDKVCQWLATGRWFFPGTLVSSINKTDRHNITEILLKVALNTINQTKSNRLYTKNCSWIILIWKIAISLKQYHICRFAVFKYKIECSVNLLFFNSICSHYQDNKIYYLHTAYLIQCNLYTTFLWLCLLWTVCPLHSKQ